MAKRATRKSTETYRRIGARMREARDALGLTAEDLARQLDVEQPTYTRYENGQNRIDLEVLKRAAQILGRPLEYFLDLRVVPPDELWSHEYLALPPEAREEAREHLRYLRHKHRQNGGAE